MKRRGYSPEFRRKVLDLVEAGRKVTDLACDLEISSQTIYTWRRHRRRGGLPRAGRLGVRLLRLAGSAANFAGTELCQTGFTDVELERCDLSNMTVRASGMHRVRTSGSRLIGMTWTECAFRDVLFDTCRADLTGFRFSTFKNTVFRDCIVPEANFQNADLRGVRFERCDLSMAQFFQAQMDGAHFSDCVLLGIGGVTSLKGATVKSRDAHGLVFALAGALGILIEE